MKAKLLGLGILVLSGEVLAGNVMSSAQESTIVFEYHADINNNDNGLISDDADATNSIRLRESRIGMLGNTGKGVTYDLNLGFSDNAVVLNWAWVEWTQSQAFSILFGKDFTNEGGWDNFNWLYNTIVLNPYTENNLPLAGAGNVVEFRYNHKAFGQINLQLVDDVIQDTDPNSTNQRAQLQFNTKKEAPAFIVEWNGDFKGFSPLIQYGTYDDNHSNFITLGLKVLKGRFEGYFDLIVDNRTLRENPTSSVEKDFVHTAATFDLYYMVRGLRPFLKIAYYDVEQPDTDLETNTNGFDDNALIVSLGTKFPKYGDQFLPYIVLINSSGEFLDSEDEKENRSQLEINVGVTGSI